MFIRDDIKQFTSSLPQSICLVIATKYLDVEEMEKLYKLGYRNFAENRVESFLTKYNALNHNDIIWHFIGHLQRNKANKIINNIDYHHSLDSLELAKLIDKKRNKPLKTFIEVSINEEQNKNGVKINDLDDFIKQVLNYKNIQLVGLMMMAIKSSDEESLRKQFAKLRTIRDHLEHKFNVNLPYLSMGMSDDYKEAILEGATHIRLGRILFKNNSMEKI